jgi:hypothetical protein
METTSEISALVEDVEYGPRPPLKAVARVQIPSGLQSGSPLCLESRHGGLFRYLHRGATPNAT